MMLRCLGVRITVSGGPIRNLRGVLVVSGHVSWVDIFAIGAVMPGRFVARAHTAAHGGAWLPDVLAADTLDTLRAMLPRGLTRHDPDVGDVGGGDRGLGLTGASLAFPSGRRRPNLRPHVLRERGHRRSHPPRL